MYFLAQLPVDPATAKTLIEGADFLSGKDVKWWFAFVLLIGGALGLIVLKWLLTSHQKYIASMETQLSEQRIANKAQNDSLITYITTDHQKGLETMNRVDATLNKLADAISRQKA